MEALKKAGSWVVDLAKHYDKLDVCNGRVPTNPIVKK